YCVHALFRRGVAPRCVHSFPARRSSDLLLVWLGAMLLGWVAGEVIATDPAIEPLLHHVLDGTVVITIEAASGLFAGKTNVSSHRSEEHTSELQSRENLVCRLLLEKKKCC